MMVDRSSPVSEDELHAYVDGELPADRRKAVEAWLALHPDDAARVHAWRDQAEEIRARYAAIADGPVPAQLDIDRLARGERRWTRLAAAAILLAFVLGGLAGWYGRGSLDGGSPAARMVTAEAIQAYNLYVVEVRHPVEVPGAEAAHLVQWLSKRLGYDVRAPNLGTLGLQLVGGRLLPGSVGGAAFFMYEGATGERYTLYCAKSAAPGSALRYRAAGPVAAYYWIDDNRAYVVSGPADRDRLLKVAQSTYDQIETSDRVWERSSTLDGRDAFRVRANEPALLSALDSAAAPRD
jgi:anti-sigma factor RsiW